MPKAITKKKIAKKTSPRHGTKKVACKKKGKGQSKLRILGVSLVGINTGTSEGSDGSQRGTRKVTTEVLQNAF